MASKVSFIKQTQYSADFVGNACIEISMIIVHKASLLAEMFAIRKLWDSIVKVGLTNGGFSLNLGQTKRYGRAKFQRPTT